MIWSISGDKQFKACKRQWYYRNIVADGKVKKDPFRREVTILSKLQNIEAFRGRIVDDVISRHLVNTLNRGISPRKDYYINEALNSFTRQLAFAKIQNYRDPSIKISQEPNYAALYEYEFDGGLSLEAERQAREDIETALTNFIENRTLIEYLRSASVLVSQRPLTYRFEGFKKVILFFLERVNRD